MVMVRWWLYLWSWSDSVHGHGHLVFMVRQCSWSVGGHGLGHVGVMVIGHGQLEVIVLVRW